jgi:ABC-type lipoprotein release transport system permease subunit
MRKWAFYISKELGQNKRVLAVILLAIGLSTGTTLFVNGLGAGFVKNFAGNIIYLTTSQMMIEPQNDERYVNNLSTVENVLGRKSWIEGYSPRTVVPSIIHDNLTRKDINGNAVGIIPSKEVKSTKIAENIYSGRFLQDGDRAKAVIGIGLLKGFNKTGGSTFNLTITLPSGKTIDVLVVGIVQAHFSQVDDRTLFVMKDDIDAVLNISDKASVILIKTNNLDKVHEYANELRQDVQGRVSTWDERADYLNDIKTNFGFVLNIVQILSLIGAVVPVAAVLYTNIVNKTKDIGIYKAIGSSRWFVMTLYSATCMIIGLSGILIGWFIGGLMILYFQFNPLIIHTPNIQYEISTMFDYVGFLMPSITIFVAILIAGLYPAWKASKVEPMEAFRFA